MKTLIRRAGMAGIALAAASGTFLPGVADAGEAAPAATSGIADEFYLDCPVEGQDDPLTFAIAVGGSIEASGDDLDAEFQFDMSVPADLAQLAQDVGLNSIGISGFDIVIDVIGASGGPLVATPSDFDLPIIGSSTLTADGTVTPAAPGSAVAFTIQGPVAFDATVELPESDPLVLPFSCNVRGATIATVNAPLPPTPTTAPAPTTTAPARTTAPKAQAVGVTPRFTG